MHNHIGTLILNNKGRGFLKKDNKQNKEEKDITIPYNFIDSSLPQDKVEVQTFPNPNKWGEIEGKVIRIIERYKTDFAGTIKEIKNNIITVIPDNSKLNCIFETADNNNFEINQKILFKIDFNKNPKVLINKTINDKGYTDIDIKRTFYGEIIKIFGIKGENNAEMHAIVEDFGFKIDHNAQTELDAKKATEEYGKITEEEIKKRLDVRDVWSFFCC